MKPRPEIVFSVRPDSTVFVHCQGCGQGITLAAPVSLDALDAHGKAFAREHKCAQNTGAANG